MHPIRHSRMVLGLALLAIMLALVCSASLAQEQKYVAPPRDTLLAAAKAMMAKARFCALITLDPSGFPHPRAMDPFPPTDGWVVWMGTGMQTRKVAEIKKNPMVTLYYADPAGSGYVTIMGTARIVDTPEAKTKWFKEEWAQFYPDRAGFVPIAVTPKRLEVVDFSKGLVGDPATWTPPAVEFK